MKNYPPIKNYLDDQANQEEFLKAKAEGPRYCLHKSMLPHKGDALPVDQGLNLVVNRGEGRFLKLSNICPHRQSPLIESQTKLVRSISCPLHCWTFDLEGNLQRAPHFDPPPKDIHLRPKELFDWNGLLFEGKAPNCDLKALGLSDNYDFNRFDYVRRETSEYDFNWKVFMEIYLENYHVFSMHPGLKNYVTPADLEWVEAEDSLFQKVGLGQNFDLKTTEVYKNFQDQMKTLYAHKELPRYGAIWGLIYPNIMLEWYPHVIVISTVYPKGAKKCVNTVEFFYEREVYKSFPDYFQAHFEAYMETAEEDNEACSLLQRGRDILGHHQVETHGPIDDFLELGVKNFYDFLAKRT